MTFDPLMWVFATNARYKHSRRSCLELKPLLGRFFTDELLAFAGFVIVDELPSPPLEQVKTMGLESLLTPSAQGLTLANTYYLKPAAAGQLRVHVHELVHVLQWRNLGAARFIDRYLQETARHGYRQAPLEQMACELEHLFALSPARGFDITAEVKHRLAP